MRSRNIDLTSGPIFKSVVLYAIPIIIAGMLQIFFNAADLAVVGHFSDNPNTTAAVGATGSSIALIVNSIIGLSVGINVVLSRSIGAKDYIRVHRMIHTAITVSLAMGVVIAVAGFFLSEPLMIATKCPQNSYDMAVSYMKIYFLGAPGILLYNFGSAILRTKGDTKRPLYFLAISGVANVILNIFFVVALNMTASGVALATTISQYISAYLTLSCLTKQEAVFRLNIKHLCVYKKELLDLIKYGLPSGITNAMFCVSNLQIQSAINAFKDSAVAGNAACTSLEGFVATGISAINATTVTFVGHNLGANNRERVKKCFWVCMAVSVGYSFIFGMGIFAFLRENISAVYLPHDPKAVDVAVIRGIYLPTMYWISGAYNVIGGAAQAFGYSTMTMINSVIGIFGVRTVWMQLFYPNNPTLDMLYICYPVTWTLILFANTLVFCYAWRKYNKKGELIDL